MSDPDLGFLDFIQFHRTSAAEANLHAIRPFRIVPVGSIAQRLKVDLGTPGNVSPAQRPLHHLLLCGRGHASIRRIVAEASFHAAVHQGRRSLSTWNVDAVEQAPLGTSARRGVDDALLHDGRAKTRRAQSLPCLAWTLASGTQGNRTCRQQEESALHRLTTLLDTQRRQLFRHFREHGRY